MIRRPPRSTLDRSSAASDVYKRQVLDVSRGKPAVGIEVELEVLGANQGWTKLGAGTTDADGRILNPVSYTHLRAHETVLDLVCRLLLEKKK